MTRREKLLKQAVIPALARPGDPLVTAQGSIVRPERKRKDVEKDQPKIEANGFKPSRKRTIGELPATPPIINGCAVVFMYTLLGLSDREIAQAVKIDVTEVPGVRQHPAYAECFDIVSKEFVSANSALLAARISAYAHDAVEKIADISANGKHETNSLRASIDLADRATGNKSSVYGGGAGNPNMGNDLRIIIVDGDKKAVNIEVNGEQFSNGGRHGKEEVIDQG